MSNFDLTVLADTIAERAMALQDSSKAVDQSYTASLLAAGREKIVRKFGEEALELVLAATIPNTQKDQSAQLIAESADLLYHLCVLWQDSGVTVEAVYAELARRQGVSGLTEKAARSDGSHQKETPDD